MTKKEIVKNNFSKYARFYDEYSGVQDKCASNLIGKLEEGDFKKILDIGCGTGNYTALLRERFPRARIKAVDISDQMVEIAKEKLKGKDVEFVTGDAENPQFNETFDLITSNASFQWLGNPEANLTVYKKFLNTNGVILFSTFGPDTFCELQVSLKKLFGENTPISSSDFAGIEKVKGALENLFKKVSLEKKVYKEKYTSLWALLRKIKYSGIRGNGLRAKNMWSQGLLSDLEKIYKENFKTITATYQVFFCRGERF